MVNFPSIVCGSRCDSLVVLEFHCSKAILWVHCCFWLFGAGRALLGAARSKRCLLHKRFCYFFRLLHFAIDNFLSLVLLLLISKVIVLLFRPTSTASFAFSLGLICIFRFFTFGFRLWIFFLIFSLLTLLLLFLDLGRLLLNLFSLASYSLLAWVNNSSMGSINRFGT